MALTKDQKEEILQNLVSAFKNQKSVIITDYTGINAEEMRKLREKLHNNNCRYKVVKKTLLSLALNKADQPEIEPEKLEGQIGVAISQEEAVSPAKIIYNFSQEQGNEMILTGIVEGKKTEKSKIIKLAQLPSRQELQTKLVGSINAPLSRLRNNLAGNINRLCMVLRAKTQQA